MKNMVCILFLLMSFDGLAQEPDRNAWENPLDPVVITTEEIANGHSPILIVYHEEGHGGWQLYDGSDLFNKQPFVLPKDEALILDPTLKEVTDLPVGWKAIRKNKDSKWVRYKL